MKRILILVVLVAIAALAGVVVRSNAGLRELVSHNSTGDVRDEIRQTYQLSPGARIELSGLNGSVKIETSDSKTAEVYIERIGSSADALARRKVLVEGDSSGVRVHGEKGDGGFLSRLFGTKPTERVTLKLPRQISLITKGVNGSVIVGEIDGPVDVRGVNGRVQIASASGTADFKGVNGNIVLGVKQLDVQGLSLRGINGNIELQLANGVNADLDAHGMNGRVVSELSEVVVQENKHGNYSARIGTGGSAINAKGINGNIRLTRN
jgi:hypothetical protein